MKVYAGNKIFNNETERDVFLNEFVGDKKYYQIPTKYVMVDGLSVTAIVRCIASNSHRRDVMYNNGFVVEVVDVK